MPGKDLVDFNKIDIMGAGDTELFTIVDKFKEDGLSGDRVFRDRAILADNFYNGFQWDNASLEELRRKRLPALTFNIIKRTVEFMVGTQEQNRKDIVVKPVKNATNSIASIYTKLVKDVVTKNNGEHLFSEWFRQGCIKGRGFIHAYRDFTEDPWTGDLRLEVVDALDCSIDPLSKMYNLADAKYLIVFKYTNIDEVIAEYPEHEDRLVNLRTDDEVDSHFSDEIFVDGGGDLDAEALNSEESRYSDRTQYRFRIQWSYVTKAERRWHLVDKEEVTDTILDSKEAIEIWQAAAQAEPDKYKVVERVDKVLYLIKSVNDIILEKIKEPFRGEDTGEGFYRAVTNKMPLVPYGAFFDNGRWQGMVDDLINPQIEKNKLRSSTLHIISTSANSGWMWKENSLDEDTEHTLRTNGAATGLNIPYKNEAPQRVPNSQFPEGFFRLAEYSNKDINDISGVNAANLGFTSTGQESGKLNELRQIQGLTSNTGIFDNFDYSMKLLGELITEIISSTQLYTDKEIELIIEDFDIFEPRIMAQAEQIVNQQMPIPPLEKLLLHSEADTPESRMIIQEQYQLMLQQRQQFVMLTAKQIVMSELHNLYKGRYGVAVTQSNFSPTVKNANMNLLFQLSSMMPGVIPPEYVIQQTDLPDKELIVQKIAERNKAIMDAQVNSKRAEVQGKIMVERAKSEGNMQENNNESRNDVITSKLDTNPNN